MTADQTSASCNKCPPHANGYSPLWYAVTNSPEVVELLLRSTGEVDLPLVSPLHEVPWKIHGRMQHTDNLHGLPILSEQNHVPSFSSETAT